jgi:hypothetical protein
MAELLTHEEEVRNRMPSDFPMELEEDKNEQEEEKVWNGMPSDLPMEFEEDNDEQEKGVEDFLSSFYL